MEVNGSAIHCLIRKIPVESQPEELVRQALLHRLIKSLGYPASLIAVEKSLDQMPHLALQGKKPPKRRADIICFGKDIHPKFNLYPLLLIECKAVPLTSAVVNQVTGYNHFIQSYFVAIANEKEVQVGWYDAGLKRYRFVPYIPRYDDLLKAL